MTSFLDLTNQVLIRTNDTQVSSADFASARNVQAMAKRAITASVAQINQVPFAWPWNHASNTTTTLTDGTREYSLPTNYQAIYWDSFRILRDTGSVINAKRLKHISIEEYRFLFADQDDNRTSGSYSTPQYVYRTWDGKFGLSPNPDKAYQVYFEYWKIPDSLVNATDNCTIPSQHDHMIVDGAMFYMASFRGNDAERDLYKRMLEDHIKTLRTLYITRSEYVSSTMLPMNRLTSVYFGNG